MPVFEHVPVEARLVHKEHLDDVLVSNFRSELPTWITTEALAACGFDAAERERIEAHYAFTRLSACAEDAEDTEEGVLLRRSVPRFLPIEAAGEEGFEMLSRYYRQAGDRLVLDTKYIDEADEILIAQRFVDQDRHLTAADRHRLAELTDRMPCNMRTERYSMNLINDLQNYFFYRKHHEHVPGMMIVEAARQAIYAQYYRTSAYARGEITLTMNSLDCRFETYVDANYPVLLSVDTEAPIGEGAGGHAVRREVRIYQRGQLAATVMAEGVAIKMKLFNRMRTIKPAPEHWFVPIKSYADTVNFRDDAGRQLEGRLMRVAQERMDILFDAPIPDGPSLDFELEVEGIGLIDGRAAPKEFSDVDGGVVGSLDLENMTLESRRRWLEAIKNFSHVDMAAC